LLVASTSTNTLLAGRMAARRFMVMPPHDALGMAQLLGPVTER
jgi:hypothetical protein